MTARAPYPAYRPTDLLWLAQIPAHWEVVSLRRKLQDGQNGIKIGPFGSSLKSEIIREQGYKVFGQENVIANDFQIGRRFIDDEKFKELDVYELFSGDIVITMMGTAGRCQVVPQGIQKGIMDSHLIRIRVQNDVNPSFLALLIDDAPYIEEQIMANGRGTIMQGLNSSIIKNLFVILPPLDEQEKILAFLDRQTAKIDALIAQKQRLLELLAEKRAALISRAVTKGLNPNVEMKDSGVPWLGQVPGHWEVSKLGYVSASLQTGPFGSQIHSDEYVSGGIPLINPAHIKDGKIFPSEDVAVDQETWERLSRHELLEGDIVFARRGEMGRCALVTEVETGWLCGTGSIRLRPDQTKIFPKHLSWGLSTKGISDWLSLESVGTTMDNLNTGILASIPLPVPPIQEQKAISDYLDYQTKRLADLAAKVETAIARLREYRAALISAAVTGKIDVSDKK